MSKNANDIFDISKLDFNDISLESLGSHLLFGEIEENTVKDAIEFIIKSNQMFDVKRDLSLFINTRGGDCYDGFALIDMMDISRHPIKTIGMGNVVSMGVLILCAGAKGKRVITKNTQIMAHQFYGGTEGKFHELVSAFKAEQYLQQQFITHFKRHSKMTEKQISEIMFGTTDTWLTPLECKKFGLVDIIIDELPDFNMNKVSRSSKSQSH